jgi:hypothetical protein
MNGPSFESLYGVMSWFSPEYGVLAGLAVGVLVFIGAPVVGPVLTTAVAKIGTAVGSLYGLSGVAATNFGLAMLGGGALSAGGLGMAGGTALLAAALTATGEVVIDKSLSEALAHYDRAAFERSVAHMVTLPIPRQLGNSKVLKQANAELNGGAFDLAERCLKSKASDWAEFRGCLQKGQGTESDRLIRAVKSIEVSEEFKKGLMSADETVVLALLHFVLKNPARTSDLLQLGTTKSRKKLEGPVFDFLMAITSLHLAKPDISLSIARLERAISAEPNTVLLNVMMSAYFDRLFFWAYDGIVTQAHMSRLERMVEGLPDQERKLLALFQMMSFHLMRAETERVRFESLAMAAHSRLNENDVELSRKRAECAYVSSAARVLPLIREAYRINDSLRALDWRRRIERSFNAAIGRAAEDLAHGKFVDSLQDYEIGARKYLKPAGQITDANHCASG